MRMQRGEAKAIRAVVKVGGSLAEDPAALRALCKWLGSSLAGRGALVVPGGWRFADAVRGADATYRLSPRASHRMAILAMDQYGLMLADLTPNSRAVADLGEALEADEAGLLPILLPFRMLDTEDPFEPSWDVTSDSIAAYVAFKAGAAAAYLLKDVDGVFTADPKLDPGARLLPRVRASELAGRRTCVDGALPRVVHGLGIRCVVLNGRFPDRLLAAIEGRPSTYTVIEP